MRYRLTHLILATGGFAVLLVGGEYIMLASLIFLAAYMGTLTLIFGKQ